MLGNDFRLLRSTKICQETLAIGQVSTMYMGEFTLLAPLMLQYLAFGVSRTRFQRLWKVYMYARGGSCFGCFHDVEDYHTHGSNEITKRRTSSSNSHRNSPTQDMFKVNRPLTIGVRTSVWRTRWELSVTTTSTREADDCEHSWW